MNREDDTMFPCERLPDRPAARRLLGVYEQRQEGLLMQRIKVQSGRLTLDQWRTMARLAQEHTPGYPLHVTTRQDVELHGLSADAVPAVHRELDRVGLTTLGAAGDTLRNVTVCPGCGICPGTMDVAGLVGAIQGVVELLPWSRELPRKFKVSISGCGNACAKPWLNDIGIVARPDGTCMVVGAGSLGARPRTGIVLRESLPVEQIVPLVVAALRLFNAEGDRENRKRARLRHVRERLGDGVFLERLDEVFRRELAVNLCKVPAVRQVECSDVRLQARLQLPRGDIEQESALDLAGAVERAGAVLRIGMAHDLLIYGVNGLDLPPRLQAFRDRPCVISCPGRTWCPFGAADSRAAEDRIIRALDDGTEAAVAVGGCPNNCAHAAVASIGMTGRIATVDGQKIEAFRLVAGGGNGRTPQMGLELHPAVPATEVGKVVAHLAAHHRRTADRGDETFAQFVAGHRDRLRDEVNALFDKGENE